MPAVSPTRIIERYSGLKTSFLLPIASERASPAPLRVHLPHASDLPFLEVAHEAGAVLVTGNPRHFPARARAGVAVLSPREFLTLVARSL